MSPGVEPRKTALEDGDVEPALIQVAPIEIGDLELAARAGFELRSKITDIGSVEIESRDGEGATRILGLLFDRERPAVLIDLDHAVALGIAHAVAEDPSTVSQCRALGQRFAEPGSVENIVPENETRRRTAEEISPEQKSLCEALWARLLAVAELHPESFATAE